MQINKILLVSVIFFNGYTAHSQDCAPACPKTITVGHTKGLVSPKTVQIIYNTKAIGNLCWITRNLGATVEATKADDTVNASRGWYYFMEHKQGYEYDGTSVTVPAYVPLVGYICTGWELKDDPCALSLGGGWHIPTKTECETTFSSVSKLSEAYSLLKIRNSGLFLGDSFGNETRAYIAISTLNNANYVSTIEFSNIAKTIGLGYANTYMISIRCVKTM